MIEQVFHLTQGNTKTIEKILMDDDIHYCQIVRRYLLLECQVFEP